MFGMDIKNIFLYGDLIECVYNQPPNYVTQRENLVYKLKKAINGLK